MKAFACVGRHNKIFYTAVTNDKSKENRLEIYLTKESAIQNSIGKDFVREITIVIHKNKRSFVDKKRNARQ